MKSIQKNVTIKLGFFKTKKGNVCAVLQADLGYKLVNLSFDEFVICSTLSITLEELYRLKDKFGVEDNET